MTTIRLTNTKTRRKEVFQPIDPDNVRMYVCGPTVYDRAHLGNARPVVVFDVLFRLLRHVYGPDHVTYVRNFTDVDDKINDAALARKEAGDPRSLEELIRERTEETIRWYHEDMDALGALRPTKEPRATVYIGAMIEMIEELIASGHAYEAEGHVLFRVRSYKDYGALSGRSVDDMIAGARVEVAPFKEDPLDFVLWKPSDETLPGWDSPWGRGRPGWHIECSAMARELLGTSFDIHGGGIDLQFPHHENEIAQSNCADPGDGFARVWMHNEMLLVDGKKMSKSLGNFFTVRDLLNSFLGENRLVSGEEYSQLPHLERAPLEPLDGATIRLALLKTHYRDKLDWTYSRLDEARSNIWNWQDMLIEGEINFRNFRSELPGELIDILSDDLNTPEAIQFLNRLTARIRKGERLEAALLASLEFLGIFDKRKVKYIELSQTLRRLAVVFNDTVALGLDPKKLISHIDTYMPSSVFSKLVKAGIAIGRGDERFNLVVNNSGFVDYSDPSMSALDRNKALEKISEQQISYLVQRREVSKRERDFAVADTIRRELSLYGIEILDHKDGPVWRYKR